MGQYHLLANLDKHEVVLPRGLDFGFKQREHAGFRGSMSDALYLLLMTSPARGGGDWPFTTSSGAWTGDRVVVLGDYTQDEDLPDIPHAGTLFGIASEDWTDISDRVARDLAIVFPDIDPHWDPVGVALDALSLALAAGDTSEATAQAALAAIAHNPHPALLTALAAHPDARVKAKVTAVVADAAQA